MLLDALTAGLSGLLIPLAATRPRAVLLRGGLGGGVRRDSGPRNIIVRSFRQAYCPSAMLGRITASMRFLVFGAIPLGALLAASLATAPGPARAVVSWPCPAP